MSEEHLDAHRITDPDACRRIVLVGEDNPLSSDPRYALYHEPRGCAGSRLQSKILGLRPRDHYLPLWRTNLCIGGFDRADAETRASRLIGEPRTPEAFHPPWTVIVMLGVKVAAAFARVTRIEIAAFTWGAFHATGGHDQIRLVSLPHPSGRNTIWSNADRVAQARALMTEVAPDVPWGEVDR